MEDISVTIKNPNVWPEASPSFPRKRVSIRNMDTRFCGNDSVVGI